MNEIGRALLMKDTQAEIQKKLAELAAAYSSNLPDRLHDIEVTWLSIQNDGWQSGPLDELHRGIHSLAGSGATFGYPRLSQGACELEQIVKGWCDSGGAHTAKEAKKFEKLLESMCESIESVSTLPPPVRNVSLPASTVSKRSPLVYLIDDDELSAKKLRLQLEQFDYRVECFHIAERAIDAVNEKMPDALLVDIVLTEGEFAGIDVINKLQKSVRLDIPIIYISTRTDFEARLRVVQAGGENYLTKPLDITVLVDRLDALVRKESVEPYRILIVDDDKSLAVHFQLVLEQAGFEVTVINEVEKVIKAISETDPELIILDIYMPGCSGIELARIIRQQDMYLGIPIVFLSTEADFDKQLVALRMGADDFLAKPVSDDRLVSSVSARVERARKLNNLMVQDSLTGLLKHTKIKERLDIELSRAARKQEPLVYAMLDIDHFKRVNDDYGHLTGDRVIKGLARMLQQRLRVSDGIGRYGGEEFALVLPDTSLNEAEILIDEIRASFADLRFSAGEHDFSVTISAGLAAFPDYKDMESLVSAADEALYQSKNSGRNRVTRAVAH